LPLVVLVVSLPQITLELTGLQTLEMVELEAVLTLVVLKMELTVVLEL
jgi:hypothetical protein